MLGAEKTHPNARKAAISRIEYYKSKMMSEVKPEVSVNLMNIFKS